MILGLKNYRSFLIFTSFMLHGFTPVALATTTYIPDDIILRIMTWMKPEDTIKFGHLNKRIYHLSTHQYLRKISPYGVTMSDKSWLYWQEAAYKQRTSEVVSFNHLPRIIESTSTNRLHLFWFNESIKASVQASEPNYLTKLFSEYSKIPYTIEKTLEGELKTKEELALHAGAVLLTMKKYLSVIRNISWDATWFSLWRADEKKYHFNRSLLLNQAQKTANHSVLNKVYQAMSNIFANHFKELSKENFPENLKHSSIDLVIKTNKNILEKALEKKHKKSGNISYRLNEKTALLYLLHLTYKSDSSVSQVYENSASALKKGGYHKIFLQSGRWEQIKKESMSQLSESEQSFLAPWLNYVDQISQKIQTYKL